MAKVLRINFIVRCDAEGCDNEVDYGEVLKPVDFDLNHYNKPPNWLDLGEWGLYCPNCAAQFLVNKPPIKKKKYELS